MSKENGNHRVGRNGHSDNSSYIPSIPSNSNGNNQAPCMMNEQQFPHHPASNNYNGIHHANPIP